MTATPERGPRWLEYLPLDELRPDPRNPKNHRLDTLRESVVRWGYSEPVQVDERTGLIVSGHGRRELLLDDRAAGRSAPEGVVVDGAGGWLVPVVRGWASTDDDEAFGYLVAANRIGEQGGWLTERLLAGLEPLAAKGPDMLAGVGYTPDDLSGLLALLQSEAPPVVGATDPDEVPEPPPEPVTRTGDLWVCGPHRVMCGDATKPEDFARLAPDGAEAILTDPPYCSGGFQEAGRSSGSIGTNSRIQPRIANDRLSTRGYMALLKAVIGVAPIPIVYIFTDWRMWVNLFDVVESSGYGVRNMVVWDKGSPGMGMGWRTQHELVLFAASANVKFDNHKAQGNVISAQRTGNPLHPTQKPVGLLISILEVTDMAKTIYDPFAGSGSTLMACQQVGRVSRLMELDPNHVDVVCRRYQEFTGDIPILESTGEPHDFCAEPAVVEPAG